MNFSESEIVALMAIAVLLNGVGLLAWRRGLLGHWYPIAIAAMLLGGFGLVVSVRHRKGGTVGAASRYRPGKRLNTRSQHAYGSPRFRITPPMESPQVENRD
jgi:hypothetical protein